MANEQWEKVSQIVDTALKLDGEERSTYIEEKCAGNRHLKTQVTKLLEAIEESDTQQLRNEIDDFVSHVADGVSRENDAKQASSLIGETIDRYKIIKLLGHGGMGSVFLAERADGAYDRKIAFKIIRRGMDTPSNIARFKRERNILARLDHPNIARLLDGGVTENGLPYLVMEYVDGTPLLQYCNKHQLSIKKRIKLFRAVCEAVQHAHRNATIHRDLKPSNIYVTGDGTVKVLDFGIAKLLETDAASTALFRTLTGSRIMTLGYAAPEQIENNPITTATDCYTLGILLYELLVGSHPLDLADKNLSKIETLIRDQSPSRPSSEFSRLPESEKAEIASRRNTTPSDLLQTLRGDLDAIVMKALRKEPEARYRSVDPLLEDLDRYEQSLPLIAKSDTLRYRIQKFMRRNRRTVIGAMLILMTAVGFGAYHIDRITEERNIAKQEAQKAETVKNFLVDIFKFSNPETVSFKGKDLSAKQLLINGQEKISKQLQDQPEVYTEVLVTIGDALTNIDAFKEAEQSYRKALEKTSEVADSTESRVRIHVKLAKLESKWRSEDQASLEPARQAYQLLNSMQDPSSNLKASVFSLLGSANVFAENYEQANSYYQKADSIYTASVAGISFDYIEMLSGYGKSLIYVSNFKKAKQVLQKSNELHREASSKPTTTIAKNYRRLGWVNRDLGNFEKSNNYFLKSIKLYRDLIGEESLPAALSMYHLSINYFLAADFEKSEQIAQDVFQIYKKRVAPTNDYRRSAKKYIAIAKYHRNELAEAKDLLQEIIKTRKKLMGQNDFNLAAPYSHLAMVYHKQGQSQKAISLLKRSIQLYKKELGEYNRRIARAKIKLAAVYRDIDKYTLARQYFQQVESIHQQVVPPKNHQQANFYFEYGKLKQDTQNPREAQKYFEKAYKIYLDNFGKDSKRTKQAKSYLEQLAHA